MTSRPERETSRGPGRDEALDLELDLLAAEVDLLEELIRRGILPPNARRIPTAPELASGVRFAELDRIVNDAAALLARKADRVRDAVLDGLATGLIGSIGNADPWQTLEELARLTDPTDTAALEGLADTITAVEDEVTEDLIATARAGHAEAIDEARRQGLPDRLLPLDDDPATATVRAAARAQAKTVAQAPATRLLDVAAKAGSTAATRPGATGTDVIEAALDAAEGASRKGTEDASRQAANVTHGLGRAAAQAALPDPREVYASELLDAATCGPCATVDGRTYATLADGLVDYPGAGGFVGCDGGSRCRGTLVLVHKTEAAPTLDNPGRGPGSPGGPADRTPRGPASPAPAPATGPMLPDPGAAPALAETFSADLEPSGRTVIPTEDLEPQVTTVAPADVERDPELARMTDAELDAVMVDPASSPERQIAAADEYDQRTAGNREQVWDEEEQTPETLARWEEEREAWERSGGSAEALEAYVPKAAGDKPKGRAIDRVRTAWAEDLELQYIAAEDATTGYLIAREKMAEFTAKYGNNVMGLFEGPAHTAYYYSSRELRDYWESIGGRPTFAEYALARGIDDAKMRGRAAAAKRAKDDAANRADESASGRAKRAAAKARKGRRTISAGDRLVLEQKRRDRLRAQERKAAAQQQARDEDLADRIAAEKAATEEAAERAAQEAAAPSLTPAQAQAIDPTGEAAYSSATRARVEAALDTEDGRALLEAAERWQRSKPEVTAIRTIADRRTAGLPLDDLPPTMAGADTTTLTAHADAILDALTAYDGRTPDVLYRGLPVTGKLDELAERYAEGNPIDLGLSSWTSDQGIAQGFIDAGRRGDVELILRIEGPTPALPLQNLTAPAAEGLWMEKEWLTTGRYRVTSATRKRGRLEVTLALIE